MLVYSGLQSASPPPLTKAPRRYVFLEFEPQVSLLQDAVRPGNWRTALVRTNDCRSGVHPFVQQRLPQLLSELSILQAARS